MSQKAIYINQIAQQTFEAKPDYYAKLAKKETMGEGGVSPITAAAGRLTLPAKKSTKNANESKLTSKLLCEIFENGAFVNADQIPLYCLEQENEKIKELIKNVRYLLSPVLPSMTLMERLFFSQASLFCEREKESAIYRCYNSDSELHALYVLQCMVDDIALKIANIVTEGEKIVKIEFHGCTTRDMCPLCYTNMNCMQFLANQKQGVGFLGALLERLKMIGRADDSIKSATFISSLEEFPSSGNILWNIEESEPIIVPGFVYQFRFTEPEITAIKDSSEESLKMVASITDLSSLGVSSGVEAASPVVAPQKLFLDFSVTGTPPSTPEDQEAIPAELKEELAAARYQILDVPGDGNCGIWAVLVAAGEITQEELQALMKAYNEVQTQYGIGVNWINCKEILEEKAKEAVEKMEEYREEAKRGVWVDSGKDLPNISKKLGKSIVFISPTQIEYYIDGECTILYDSIGQIMKGYPEAVFIYFDPEHRHYQAIVKQ